MGRHHRIRRAWLALTVLPLAGCGDDEAEGRVSSFGRYEGYSEERFTEWVATSEYVEMRDGVRLAVDVTRPAVNGVAVDEPLPVVWTHSRYHRNPRELIEALNPGADASGINSMVDAQPDLQRLVRHGYVVAAAGVRGSGASYGRYEGLFSEAETDDAADLIGWLATQPWSDGNVGMYGGSYLGITQYMAASEGHPALKAIFPVVAGLDMHDVLYPGGVYRSDLIRHWGELTRDLDLNVAAPRVDADVEGVQLREAIAEHEDNWDVLVEYGGAPYRDTRRPELDWERHGPSGVLPSLREAAVPSYHWNGWYDIFVTDATLLFANYAGPQRLGIGPWSHGPMPDSAVNNERLRLRTIEQHRWFDYWLKGIDNGVMDGPPVQYAVMEHPDTWSWESSSVWPPSTTSSRYHFDAGPSGSVGSVNDGRLVTAAPEAPGADRYVVDFTTTTGTSSRWDNAVGAAPVMIYPDLAATDARSLTYTTGPLEADVTVVGHPVVSVFLSSSTPDAAVHVLLEEVDADGGSRYVTEAVARASTRLSADAPWDNLGLPFHRNYEQDRAPLTPETIVEVRQDLHPTATVFNAGHRIRVTIMGADADNTERVPARGTPTITVHRGSTYPSGIVLPIRD